MPPFRVQGYSIAGEESWVQIPELDVCFDIGRGHRSALTSNHIALSHGHMDHAAGLAYYFSQRQFQGMGVGTVLCHPKLVEPINQLMGAWTGIENQQTNYKVLAMEPGESTGEYEVKRGRFLRAFHTDHTSPSLGFVVIEKRSKLKEEFQGFPDERIRQLKQEGVEITQEFEHPLVAYMGDTAPGDFFLRDDVKNAQILITECTFLEPGHKDRAGVGKHMHVSDLVELLPKLNNENIVLTHLSRRIHLGQARDALHEALPDGEVERVHLLMDGRTNKTRYLEQLDEAEARESIAD